MTLSRWALTAGETDSLPLDSQRNIWIQVVKGKLTINGQSVKTSDALALREETLLSVQADTAAEVLIFDLPPV